MAVDEPSTRYIARSFGLGVEVTHNSLRTTLSENSMIIWALI